MGWQEVSALETRIIGPVSYSARYAVEGDVGCLIWLIGLKRATAIANELAIRGHLNATTFCGLAREEAGEVALRYPFHSDYAWYATDRDGHIAGFSQFVRGPIPLVVLEHWKHLGPLDDYLQALPQRSGPPPPVVRDTLHRPTITDGQRGLFMYDWGHHGDNGARNDQYDREDVPAVPIMIDEIPEPHRTMIGRVQFTDICFAEYPRIDLHQLPPYAPAMPTDDIDI